MIAAALLAPAIVVSGSTSGTTTDCSGGTTSNRTTNLTGPLGETQRDAAPGTGALVEDDIYLDKGDFTLWQDTNGIPGIQRTDRVCYVTDARYRVIDKYTVYGADEQIA